MVPKSHGGNNSSTVPEGLRVLERVSLGEYRIVLKILILTIFKHSLVIMVAF
jgi:hypothetical protein